MPVFCFVYLIFKFHLFILYSIGIGNYKRCELAKKSQIVGANDILPFRTHHVLPSVSAAQNKSSISQQSGCEDDSECLPDEVHTRPCLHGWDQVALQREEHEISTSLPAT